MRRAGWLLQVALLSPVVLGCILLDAVRGRGGLFEMLRAEFYHLQDEWGMQ
jgi:hypothetical protein